MTPPLNTPVPVPPMPFRIGFDCGIVTLGSCFSDEIGTRLKDGGFRIEANPFGTLYNPASIANALERIIACREVTEADLVQHDGLWHSWHHHGSFSHPTINETLEACNASLHRAHEALLSARILMITFGTAWVFEVKGESSEFGVRSSELSGCSSINSELRGVPSAQPTTPNSELPTKVVANCHKLPPQMFTRRRMTVDEIVSLWQPLLKKLRTHNSELTTIFTVSPIRHMADGAHGNQLSKATLLLAVEQLASCGHYFPSYEIILDELRDYRFFGPDMTHPSPLAVDIVYDRFQQATMSPATIQQAHNNAKAARRQRHIPLH